MAEERILVVDDEHLIRWSLQQSLEKEGYRVFVAETGEEALDKVKRERPDLILLDIRLPGLDGLDVLKNAIQMDPNLIAIMITAAEDVDTVVKAMQLGAFDYITKPFQFPRIHLSIRKALAASQSKRADKLPSRSEQKKRIGLDRIIAVNKEMEKLLQDADRIAQSDVSTVLIQGESGTGKELLAHWIHDRSKRENMPFVSIDCTRFPDHLLEQELFGPENEGFAGPDEVKKGLLEMAGGGTLFLDDIGDTPLNLQSKLLRLLEQKTSRRLGNVKGIHVDVRIVAATNKDLFKLKEEGKLREDFFYHINLPFLKIPPLRKRQDDIMPLVKYFVQKYNQECQKDVQNVSDEVQECFMKYSWPGNVLELKNVIEKAMIFVESDVVGIESLPMEIILLARDGKGFDLFQLPDKGISLEKVEENFVRQALAMTNGNQTKAAKLLDISRDALRYRMQKIEMGNSD